MISALTAIDPPSIVTFAAPEPAFESVIDAATVTAPVVPRALTEIVPVSVDQICSELSFRSGNEFKEVLAIFNKITFF